MVFLLYLDHIRCASSNFVCLDVFQTLFWLKICFLNSQLFLPKGISFVVSKYKWPLFALQILKLDANTIKLHMNVVWKILSKKRDTKLRIQKAYLKPKQCLKYIQTYKI